MTGRRPGRRRARKKRSRGEALLLRAAVLFLLLILCFWGMNARLRPIITSTALAQVNNLAMQIMDQAIREEAMKQALTYDSIVTLEKDGDGYVTALKTNMNEVNRVRAELTDVVVDRLKTLELEEIHIPAGSLTGIDLLSGRGPSIPVKVLSVGSVHTDFENSFQAASISQTRHCIMMSMQAKLTVLLPGYTVSSEVGSKVNVAETVIVGTVPNSYTYFSQFETARDAAEVYNDYGPGANDRGDDWGG